MGKATALMDRVGVGPRALAVIIDMLVLFVFSCCVFLIVTLAAGGEWEVTGGPGLLVDVFSAAVLLGYFVILEGTSGATLGKRLLKLRVVRTDGSALTMRESLIRNLLRIVDGFAFYLVGAILIWTSPDRQRLGDRVAKTYVVRDAPAAQPFDEPAYPQQPRF